MHLDPSNMHGLKERLGQHGLKATMQRVLIYQVLLESKDHPTVERIYERINCSHPSISLGTVYKTLDSLVQAGLVNKVMSKDDVQRFDAITSHHNHVYCVNTDQILDYEDDELQKLLQNYFASKNFDNFKITDFQVQINGEIIDGDKEISIS